MKKFIVAALLCVGFSLPAQITFMKHYGGLLNQSAYSVKQCFDGGYIVAGYHNNGTYHFCMMRIDSAGNTIWLHQYYNNSDMVAFDVIQTPDSGFIASGYRNATNPQCHLLKVDANGDSLWDRNIGSNDWGQAIVRNNSGGYALAGSDMFLTDSAGTLLWSSPWSHAQFMYLLATADGGYALASGGPGHIYLTKTDSMGTVLWTQTYDGELYNPTNNILTQTHDGGYALVGLSLSNTQLVIRTDSLGDTLWTRQLAQYYACGVVEQANGNFGVAGNDITSAQMYLTILDSSGMILSTQDYGYSGHEYCQSIAATADGGYILAGSTTTYTTQMSDFFVVKTDSAGYAIGVGVNEELTNSSSQLYPNPATEHTTLYLGTATADGELEIYNTTGACVADSLSPEGKLQLTGRTFLQECILSRCMVTENICPLKC